MPCLLEQRLSRSNHSLSADNSDNRSFPVFSVSFFFFPYLFYNPQDLNTISRLFCYVRTSERKEERKKGEKKYGREKRGKKNEGRKRKKNFPYELKCATKLIVSDSVFYTNRKILGRIRAFPSVKWVTRCTAVSPMYIKRPLVYSHFQTSVPLRTPKQNLLLFFFRDKPSVCLLLLRNVLELYIYILARKYIIHTHHFSKAI